MTRNGNEPVKPSNIAVALARRYTFVWWTVALNREVKVIKRKKINKKKDICLKNET
jgi:hypothetical protein